MILGIVGHAQEKFTTATEAMARNIIRDRIAFYKPDFISSGRSPMGGVDIYAEEIAAELGIPTKIFVPLHNRWDGVGGYKNRNLLIAAHSDLVLCIVIAKSALPYGIRDWGKGYCYHCKGRNPDHVKSGGCWTAWQCEKHEWQIIR